MGRNRRIQVFTVCTPMGIGKELLYSCLAEVEWDSYFRVAIWRAVVPGVRG